MILTHAFFFPQNICSCCSSGPSAWLSSSFGSGSPPHKHLLPLEPAHAETQMQSLMAIFTTNQPENIQTNKQSPFTQRDTLGAMYQTLPHVPILLTLNYHDSKEQTCS